MPKKSGGKAAGNRSNKTSKTSPRRTAEASSAETDETDIENNDNEISDEDETTTAEAGAEGSNGKSESEDESEAEKRGKRQIFFVMCGNVVFPEDNDEAGQTKGEEGLVLEFVPIPMPEGDGDSPPDLEKGRKEAIAFFESKYGSQPEIVDQRAIYIRKGTTTPQRKRETLNVTVAEKAPFSGEEGEAIHVLKGIPWKVMVQFTKKPNIVWVYYKNPVDPKSVSKTEGKKNQRPPVRYLPISNLKDITKKLEDDSYVPYEAPQE